MAQIFGNEKWAFGVCRALEVRHEFAPWVWEVGEVIYAVRRELAKGFSRRRGEVGRRCV